MEIELTKAEIISKLTSDYNDEFVHSHYKIEWIGSDPKQGHINISDFEFKSDKGLILTPISAEWDYEYELHLPFGMPFSYFEKEPVQFGATVVILTYVKFRNTISKPEHAFEKIEKDNCTLTTTNYGKYQFIDTKYIALNTNETSCDAEIGYSFLTISV